MNRDNTPVFVDANIPMYSAGKEHPLQAACRQAMTYIGQEIVDVVTDVEVHQEILHRYLSLNLSEQARQVSFYFQQLVPVILPITLDDLMRARDLSAIYPTLPARDLIHVAVMLNHGLARILTADTHFDAVSEIERIPPERLVPDQS